MPPARSQVPLQSGEASTRAGEWSIPRPELQGWVLPSEGVAEVAGGAVGDVAPVPYGVTEGVAVAPLEGLVAGAAGLAGVGVAAAGGVAVVVDGVGSGGAGTPPAAGRSGT